MLTCLQQLRRLGHNLGLGIISEDGQMRAAMRARGVAWLIFILLCVVLQRRLAVAQDVSSNVCHDSRRSAVLAARNGGNRAYVETTANRPQPKAGRNPETACANRSKLFVSSSGEAFDLVFMQAPTQEWPGNEMKVIDWSPSGQYLLVDLFTFQYEGEGAGHSPLIYDADSGLVYEPDLYRLFRRHFHRNCSINASAEGFTSDGLVLVRTSREDPDGTYEPKTLPACPKQKGFWSLNFKKGDVQLLGDHYEVKRYSQ
jgi:hypothetical protein